MKAAILCMVPQNIHWTQSEVQEAPLVEKVPWCLCMDHLWGLGVTQEAPSDVRLHSVESVPSNLHRLDLGRVFMTCMHV